MSVQPRIWTFDKRKMTRYQRRKQNLPNEIIRYILEYLNDFDVNREFNICNKLKNTYNTTLNSIMYNNCSSSYASLSFNWGTIRSNTVIQILSTSRYFMNNLIEQPTRTAETNNNNDIIQIIYGKTSNNRYMKEIQIRKLKSNSIDLTDEEFQEKYNKEQRQIIWSEPIEPPYYWDNITSCIFSDKELM